MQNTLSNDMKNKFLKKLEEFKCFVISNDRISCKFCSFEQKNSSKITIKPFKQHIKTEKHKNNQIIYEESAKLLGRGYLNGNEMDTDILNLICKANLPFSLIDNYYFRNIFKKLGVNLVSGQNYRSEKLKIAAMNILNKKIDSVINKNIYISFDETLDSMGRKIFNIIVGELSPSSPINSFLLYSGEVQSCKAHSLLNLIQNELNRIMPHNFQKPLLKLIISDGAAYCKKIGVELKNCIKILNILFVCVITYTICANQ